MSTMSTVYYSHFKFNVRLTFCSASVNEVDERRLPPSTVSSAPESSKIPKWKEIVSAASSAPSANGVNIRGSVYLAIVIYI